MPHPVLTASQPHPVAPLRDTVARPPAWQHRRDPGPDVAILLFGCPDASADDVVAAVRGYRTVLPRATLFLFGRDVPEAVGRAAAAAGATVRPLPPGVGGAAVRRMLAEVDADVYILAHGANPDDVCLAPLILAEIDQRGCDLVDVSRFGEAPGRDAGDRLLARTVEFLFGRGGDLLSSDVKACSRRFAVSYRAGGAGRDRPAALDLPLHALRLRLPTGSVTALGTMPAMPRTRGASDWAALLALVGGLLVEQRPRRVLGFGGLGLVAAGVAVALPALAVHGGQATLPLCASTLSALALVGCGGLLGVAGAALDALASARQEVARVGVAAIPRRAERPRPQSSVS